MPTYRYRCARCGDELDERQSFSDAPLTIHADCGGKLAKVFSTPGIVLKGSGFYRTDSRNGSSRSPKPTEKPEKSAKSETSESSSKPEPSGSGTSGSGSKDTSSGSSDTNPTPSGSAASS